MRQAAILLLLILLLCPLASAQFTDDNEYCGNVNLFFSSVWSDIPGYYTLDQKPCFCEQTILSKSLTAASGDVLLGSFITPPGKPGVPFLMPGYTRYRTYHSTTTLGIFGVNSVFFRFYNRSLDGTETRIYYEDTQTQSDVSSTALVEYSVPYAKRNYTTLFPGDRFVVKAYAKTTSGVARNITMSIGGATNVSMVASGFYPCDESFPTAPALPDNPAPPMVPDAPDVSFYIGPGIAILVGLLLFLR